MNQKVPRFECDQTLMSIVQVGFITIMKKDSVKITGVSLVAMADNLETMPR